MAVFPHRHLRFGNLSPTLTSTSGIGAVFEPSTAIRAQNPGAPNPDPIGVQQGGNNNGVQVHVLPDGNINTNNFSAINLGNGENHVDVNSASVVGKDRAINLGTQEDQVTLHAANLESEGSNIFFEDGNDNLVIEDSTLTTTVGGVTIIYGRSTVHTVE